MEQLRYTSTSDAYFESIRPYQDNEVASALKDLLSYQEVQEVIRFLLPYNIAEDIVKSAEEVHSIYDFKVKILAPTLRHVLKQNSFSITASGRSQFSPNECYLFISNHRDIVMDSALINAMALEAGLSLPRIAIGDNLLIHEWIRTLVRLSGAFVVKRKPQLREALEESNRLSHYIRTSIVAKESSIWMAQREGRTKDSNDTTQPAILKMLSMSSTEKDYGKALGTLNISPVSLSYEYDPCDYLKAKEMLQRRLNPSFQKSPQDDLLSMKVGIIGNKGRVHIAFTPPFTDWEELSTQSSSKQDLLTKIGQTIDQRIFLGYRFYPSNYISYDLLNGGDRFKEMYSVKERANFELYLEHQIDKITMEGKDSAFLLKKLLEMYANPLRNNLITKKEIRS